MFNKKQNEMSFPEVYYAKHMQEGVVSYPEDKEINYLSNETLTEMAKTFDGKPVLVKHQEIDLDHLKEQADGYVVDNFYNKYDGWWWVKFIAVSDEAKNAIRQGWKVSNCYINFQRGQAGTKHGVHYDCELLHPEYEHLAIVENPRYEESIILTEDEYNDYINNLKSKLNRRINSKEKHMFKLFQKKVNEVEVDDMYVELGNGESMLLTEALDKFEALKKEDADAEEKANRKMCNSEDEVTLHDGSNVKIKDIVERLNKCNEEGIDEKEEKPEEVEEPKEETEEPKEEEKENEGTDKRELIDEIGGILKDKVDDEIIRTVMKKCEEIAYNGSETSEKDNEAEDTEDAEDTKCNEEGVDEKDEEEISKKSNSADLRNAFNNSGMNYDITKSEDYLKGVAIAKSLEKAKELGI